MVSFAEHTRRALELRKQKESAAAGNSTSASATPQDAGQEDLDAVAKIWTVYLDALGRGRPLLAIDVRHLLELRDTLRRIAAKG